MNEGTKWNNIKDRTKELYMSLPQNKEERMKRLDIRDQVIELNYTFFGYVASHTYVANTSITYEDKFQSALVHFCEIWWKYLWEGDETQRGYRTDLSFAVFFKPRVSEMIERELSEVKYSLRRALCMEVGAMLGKHWAKVTYEDLSDPRVVLPADKMNSLKSIFGVVYVADLAEHSVYIEAPQDFGSIETLTDDKFGEEDYVELLIQEMVQIEEKLTDKHLKEMSEVYQVDLDKLQEALPIAEATLYQRLKTRQDIQDTY